MFGFKRNKKQAPDNQIPYEVYETLRQPVERRRMFIIRLIAALTVATLLIFGSLALSRKILHVGESNKASGNSQSTQSNQGEGGSNPSPAPQNPPSETETPAPTPQPSSDTNTTTVRKPE